MAESGAGGREPAAFTAKTRRMHTAIRVIAYSLASLFMIVMVWRGLTLTGAQMEAEAERSIRTAVAAIEAGGSGQYDSAALLKAVASPGVQLRIEGAGNAAGGTASPDREIRRIPLASGTLIAEIDRTAISQAAWDANTGYMLFVLALGLPVIAIFLYMGWAVNRPALEMLAFAQADPRENRPAPKLPAIWDSVLARLKQLKDSQTQMQAFLDHAPIGMMFRDAGGQLAMINRYGASFYDLSAEELARKPISFFDAYFPESARLAQPLFLGPLAGEETSVETEFHGPSGERMNLLIKSFPVTDDAGAVTLIGNFFVDVTEERRAETELTRSQATLQAFFDNLPGLAFLSSNDGQIIAANSYLTDEFGLPDARAEDLIGKEGRKLLPKSWSGAADQAIETNRRDGKSFAFDAELKTPRGVRYVSTVRFPIRNADGETTHVGGLVFDRTAQKQASEALLAARESLHQTEKLAALGQLLAGVSHELNNPLAAVIGQASLLAEDLDGTDHAERVAKIQRAAERCARIVQSFLALARQRPPEYRTVSLADLVRQAVELTEYQMRAANVQVFVGLDPKLPPIEADPDQLHQVLVNLLTNARQALEGVEGERRIGISAERAGKMVRMRVIDNGKGIPPDMRGRIFDPFFTTKDVGSGTGIGLSYSLGIVEAHGGTLTLEDVETGTGFAITIPAAKQGAADDSADASSVTGAKGRALVIDDEADVADTLKDMLTRLGLDVTVAIGGKAGLAAIGGDAGFDLILSDIRMPEIDGPAIHAWIAAHRPELSARLAFVTGDTLGGEVSAFLARVDCPVLEKPFTGKTLAELLERIVQP